MFTPYVEMINETGEHSTVSVPSPYTLEMEMECKQHSIYKLPAWITDLNPNAYKPRLVSFGPYHDGEPNLMPMEIHKDRALVRFMERSNINFYNIVDIIKPVVEVLKSEYDALDAKFRRENVEGGDEPEEFAKMMIRDGCFMLEILLHYCEGNRPSVYTENDPIFGTNGKYLVPYIRRDMLMLENQLPMLLLITLLPLAYRSPGSLDDYMNKLIINFCCPRNHGKKNSRYCKHVLDAYRKSLLWDPNHPKSEIKKDSKLSRCLQLSERIVSGCQWWTSFYTKKEKKDSEPEGPEQKPGFVIVRDDYLRLIREPTKMSLPGQLSLTMMDQIPSAMELHEAGIRIQKSKSENLNDVSFKNSLLRLPPITVDDATEPVLQNLIAFEMFHHGIGNEVTSYVSLMDDIVDSGKDVSLLRSLGIIHVNGLGSDETVAKMFNSLTKDVPIDMWSNDLVNQVRRDAARYSRKPWNQWRANLLHTYFKNPWTTLSLIGAFVILALTVIQTIYTAGQYYQNNGSKTQGK